MSIPFREFHLLKLLETFENQSWPLDRYLNNYFRSHSAIGSKDRQIIADWIYGMFRWKGLLDYLSKPPYNWEKRFQLFREGTYEQFLEDQKIPLHIRLSFPKDLFDLLEQSHGIQKAVEICQISNKSAPSTVRVNTLKITREKLLEKWQTQYAVNPCELSLNGIVFLKKVNFFTLPEFKEGFFEVQDEGSQLLAELIDAKPKELILDYCSGSGGKTLAFAPKMNGSGQIFLHDIRPYILEEAKKRLKRAGIQNAQILLPDSTMLAKLKKKMDWILVDVPCSGTGTLRRNPDMKWKFSPEHLKRLIGLQRNIFEKALSFLSSNGKIVYGTCSLLKEENQEQVDFFKRSFNLKVEGEAFQTLPKDNAWDGFFGVILSRY